jgi:hypothetical protein
MKAILKFDLSDPDDIMSHKRCIKADDMALALFQISGLIKKSEWFLDQNPDKDAADMIDFFAESISNILEEKQITEVVYSVN